MKKLFATMALAIAAVGITPAVSAPTQSESHVTELGLSDIAWKNSAQRWSVWNGSDWAPGLIVRDNGTPTKYAVGEYGLTVDIIYNPQAAAAWAREMTGNGYIKPIGKDTMTRNVTLDANGDPVHIHKKYRSNW